MVAGVRYLKKVLDDSYIEMAIFNTNKGQIHSHEIRQYLALDLKISSSLKNSTLTPSNFLQIFEKLTNFWVAKKNSSFQKIFSDFFPESEAKDQETLFSSVLDKNSRQFFFDQKIRFHRETLVGVQIRLPLQIPCKIF